MSAFHRASARVFTCYSGVAGDRAAQDASRAAAPKAASARSARIRKLALDAEFVVKLLNIIAWYVQGKTTHLMARWSLAHAAPREPDRAGARAGRG